MTQSGHVGPASNSILPTACQRLDLQLWETFEECHDARRSVHEVGPRPLYFWCFSHLRHHCALLRGRSLAYGKNITLWYACPWTLSVASVQAGGLGMVALGLAHITAARA